MRHQIIFVLGTALCFLQSVYGQADEKPLLWMSLDELEIKRNEVKMERGETFLPKEKMAYVTDEINGEKSEVFGKYYESVKGVTRNALLLDGYTSFIEIPGNKNVNCTILIIIYPVTCTLTNTCKSSLNICKTLPI